MIYQRLPTPCAVLLRMAKMHRMQYLMHITKCMCIDAFNVMHIASCTAPYHRCWLQHDGHNEAWDATCSTACSTCNAPAQDGIKVPEVQ